MRRRQFLDGREKPAAEAAPPRPLEHQHLADIGAVRLVRLRRLGQHHGADEPLAVIGHQQMPAAIGDAGKLAAPERRRLIGREAVEKIDRGAMRHCVGEDRGKFAKPRLGFGGIDLPYSDVVHKPQFIEPTGGNQTRPAGANLPLTLIRQITAMVQDILQRPAKTSPVDAPPLVPDTEPAPELTIILPTFNERDNLPVIIERVGQALTGVDWEILIVDDNSPDGTSAVARALGENDRRIRCIRRVGRRGLAGACIEGMLASPARYLAVMDADLQHDETQFLAMLNKLRAGDTDLVAASRYIDARTDAGFSASRARASHWSTALARTLLKVELTDPMSGFFMLRRDVIDALAPRLSTQGFKILLDIAATGRGALRIAEIPFVFGTRLHGESKLDARVVLDFGQLLLAKATNDRVSFRFVLFCLVGLSGVAVHMAALAALHALALGTFSAQQAAATAIAIAWNYVFNNAFTYRDQRLAGWPFVKGLIEFELICAVGAISNVGIANLLYNHDSIWWIAGLGGAVMGAVWNYAVSAAFVWRSQ